MSMVSAGCPEKILGTLWAPSRHPNDEKGVKSMLTRLADRVEKGKDGKPVKVIRYGLWGTNAEIERHGRKFVVFRKGKEKESFRTLEEAEQFMTTLIRRRG